MRLSLQTFALSLFIVVALIIIGIGLLPGMNPWVSVVMTAVLLALPLLNKLITSRRYVGWRDDLSVGIESIDNDHKKLLTLINNLQSAAHYNMGESFERQALQELADYTKYHFEREERLMREHEYPDYEAHEAQHREMIDRVNDALAAYDKNPEDTVNELTKLLKSWLLRHIAGTDQQYSEYLRSRGVS